MDSTNASQQDTWENNVYLLTTTRVLMAFGFTFLIRSVYQLYQRMRSVGGNAGAVVAAGREAVEVDLEALALGAFGDAAMTSSGPFDGTDETLEITLPQPTYSPQTRSSPSPVSPRQ